MLEMATRVRSSSLLANLFRIDLDELGKRAEVIVTVAAPL
jgi:hypothetical protein